MGGGWTQPISLKIFGSRVWPLQGFSVWHMKSEICNGAIWGFPKIRGTFLGVPIIRIIVS